MAIQTLRISELIKVLQGIKKEIGDVPVIHQRDPEGNGFGTINARSICVSETEIGTTVFIEPYDEDIEEELYSSCY